MSRTRKVLTAAAVALAAVGGSVAVALQASAAAGCRVDYTVTSQWQGGFGADVKITNLGDAVSSWTLGWSFASGQTVSQLWNGSYTQSGTAVTVRNVSYNGSIATNGSTSFGFNGAFTSTNPVPAAFTLNGTACTGGVTTPSSSPATSPSSSPSSSPSTSTGPITGSAAQLVADMGKGWNLGNQLEANSNGIPSETAWGNPVITGALIDRVKAAGFKTIRIPVSYLGKIGAAPNYTVDAAWLTRIQEVVNLAHDRGLFVLINMHGDGYKSVGGAWLICDAADQTTIKAKYQKVWQQVASKFASYSGRLIFESMNENFDGQYGNPTQPCYSNINAYNQIFIDTVRQTGGSNTSRWLLVPGWNTNIDHTVGSGFVLPTDQYRSSSIPAADKRIMISVHYYDPWDFTGTESGAITQWGPNATDASKKSTWGQQDFMDSQLKKMYDKFVVNGYPVFVGEYGSIDKTSADSTNNRYRADYARTMVATAKKYGAATAYWDNGYNGQYGFGLFNRSTATVTQQSIIDAIMSA
ncbi:cellulase family glycosylhydrolase [Actinoplanes sp. NPDC026670]|uniref:cellulase family glycosylhydrolase n=1 Tax=Actinoplanes sp. NPDC026670 TaxID=3154700 RepID=UPI0033F2F308